MADLEIGPLDKPRRGVSIGAFLVCLLIAAALGAAGWEVYGDAVRLQLGIGQDQRPPSPSPSSAAAPTNDDVVAALKDLQTSQKRTADQLDAAVDLLNAQRASSKTLAEGLTALGAKVDALQRPPTPPPVRRPAIVAPRKPPAPPPPVAATPEPPPGAPTPRDQ